MGFHHLSTCRFVRDLRAWPAEPVSSALCQHGGGLTVLGGRAGVSVDGGARAAAPRAGRRLQVPAGGFAACDH